MMVLVPQLNQQLLDGCSLLAKGFSSITDFYNFTKKFNDDVTRANNSAEIPIHVLYLESSVVECTLQDFLTKRWNLLTGVLYFVFRDFDEKYFSLGRIKGIQSFHQFKLSNDGTILCRKTSNSVDYEIFNLRKDDGDDNQEQESVLQSIKAFEDITAEKFLLVEHDHKRDLARVCAIDKVHQIVEVQCYKPAFPHSSKLASYTKIQSKLTVQWNNIIASFLDEPKSGSRTQLFLSSEQFNDIHTIFVIEISQVLYFLKERFFKQDPVEIINLSKVIKFFNYRYKFFSPLQKK